MGEHPSTQNAFWFFFAGLFFILAGYGVRQDFFHPSHYVRHVGDDFVGILSDICLLAAACAYTQGREFQLRNALSWIVYSAPAMLLWTIMFELAGHQTSAFATVLELIPALAVSAIAITKLGWAFYARWTGVTGALFLLVCVVYAVLQFPAGLVDAENVILNSDLTLVWPLLAGGKIPLSFGFLSLLCSSAKPGVNIDVPKYSPTGSVSPLKWSDKEIGKVKEESRKLGHEVQFRSQTQAAARSKFEAPLAFICHDSRDKEIARKIAVGLQRMKCPVWYDEFSLKVGDNLRESIEAGLRSCKKCVLILSPNFFSNNGWTKREFDSIFTREILEERRLVLPVWLDVSKQQVFDYSACLLNIKGVDWTQVGEDETMRRLYLAIEP
jgi:hypothetical protein